MFVDVCVSLQVYVWGKIKFKLIIWVTIRLKTDS